MNARCGAHPPLSIPALPFQIYSTLHPPAVALRLDTAHNSSSPVRSSLLPCSLKFHPALLPTSILLSPSRACFKPVRHTPDSAILLRLTPLSHPARKIIWLKKSTNLPKTP